MKRIDLIRDVVRGKTPASIDGVEVDYRTASRLLSVYSELGAEDSRECFEILPMETVVRFAYAIGGGRR